MNRPIRSSSQRAIPAFGLAALLWGLATTGCGSETTFLLDSDIPIPPDSAGRATTGIERRNGVLVNVDTVFSEKVDDPTTTLRSLERRFAETGWSVDRRGSTGSTAVVYFVKDDRSCSVRVIRNELDPAMGRVAYRLRLREVAESAGPRNDDG